MIFIISHFTTPDKNRITDLDSAGSVCGTCGCDLCFCGWEGWEAGRKIANCFT